MTDEIGLQDFQSSHLHSTVLHMDQLLRGHCSKQVLGAPKSHENTTKHTSRAFSDFTLIFEVLEGILLFNFRSNFYAIQLNSCILHFGDLWSVASSVLVTCDAPGTVTKHSRNTKILKRKAQQD